MSVIETDGPVVIVTPEDVEKVASYYGSKRKWLEHIQRLIPEDARTILDPTCGMGWALYAAALKGLRCRGNEAGLVPFTFSKGFFEGEPVDNIDSFLDVQPVDGRMSKIKAYAKAPRDLVRHLDGLAKKANRLQGGKRLWARALVANALTYGGGAFGAHWDQTSRKSTWPGVQSVIKNAHEQMVEMRKKMKGRITITQGDVRGVRWGSPDVVFLDPPYFGTGMTLYSKHYGEMAMVIDQNDTPFSFKDLTEEDFFDSILPKATASSKLVLLCWPSRYAIGKRLSNLGYNYKVRNLENKNQTARIMSHILDASTRMYLIQGKRTARKAQPRYFVLGSRGAELHDDQPDAQSIQIARMGANYPHLKSSALIIDADGARVLIDAGADHASRLGEIDPDAIILTFTDKDEAGGLAAYKKLGLDARVFVPVSQKDAIKKWVPESMILTYEPGDELQVLDMDKIKTFSPGGQSVGIRYRDMAYTPVIPITARATHSLEQEIKGANLWLVDARGVGPQFGSPLTKGHPALYNILKAAETAGVKRVLLMGIPWHGMTEEDYKAAIAEFSKDSGIAVEIARDGQDANEVLLVGTSLFVKEEYDPGKVNDAQMGDDFRLVAAKYSTMREGGKTEFKNTEEVLDFAERVVKEILRRGKITFHFDEMKPRSQEMLQAIMARLVKRGLYLVEPHARLIYDGEKDTVVKSKEFKQLQDFHILLTREKGKPLAFGFIRMAEPKKINLEQFEKQRERHKISDEERAEWWGDEKELWSYKVRDFIPLESPRAVSIPQGVQVFVQDIALKADFYDRDYYAGLSNITADFVSELGAVLQHIRGHNILDLGCGSGRALSVLEESGMEVVGVDSSRAAVEICSEADLDAYRADAQELGGLFQNGSFDSVYSMHLLEHTEDPCAVLNESIRIARKRAVHLVPLGKRQDPSHKHTFMSLDEVRTLAADIYGAKTIMRGPDNTALIIIDRELESQGQVLDLMNDFIIVPSYVSLAGGAVKQSEPLDVDLVIREEEGARNESLELRLRNQLPETMKAGAHFIYNPRGPHDDHIPIFDLALIRRQPSERVNVEKRVLKPFAIFTPLKTGRGYTLQEFFDIDILYERWAKPFLDEGTPLDVETKYSGWRTVAQKNSNGDVMIYFEDSRKNRANQFPDLRDEIKSIEGPVILDMDLGAITDKGNVMARKDLAYWGGAKTVPLEFETPAGEKGRLSAHVFDILYTGGEDIHTKPWSERRAALNKLFGKHDFKIMRPSSSKIVKTKQALVNEIKRVARLEGSEGAVIKVTTSDYPLTGQTPAWAKIKNALEIKVQVLDRKPVKGSSGVWNYFVGYKTDGEILKLTKTFNTKIDAKTGDIMTITAEEVIPVWNEDKGRWEVSVVVPRAADIDVGRKTPENAEDIIARAWEANILQVTDELRDKLKKEGVIKALREGGLSFKEGDIGEGVLQTHEMGLTEDQSKLTDPFGWEAVKINASDIRILQGLVSGDWTGAIKSSAEGKSDRLNNLVKKIDRENLTESQRRAVARVDLVSIHTDFRLRPGKEAYWEGGEGFTPGSQFQANKFLEISRGDDDGKILGNFKISRQAEGGTPYKVEGQELIRGPIVWMKMGIKKPEIFPPGEIGATANAWGRILNRDQFKWIAGIQDKHFKEFWFEGNVLKGRWIFQFVPVTQIKGAKRAWMISRPKDQRMKSEEARKVTGQD